MSRGATPAAREPLRPDPRAPRLPGAEADEEDEDMGWARTLLLGDIGNRLDIEDTERDIRELEKKLRDRTRKDREQDRELADLRAELERVQLSLAALLRLLVGKGVLTRGELEAFAGALEPDDRT